jgi:RNA polymerase sigma factor (sigma-70 family)
VNIDPDSLSDGELAVLALAGRQAAFGALMERYKQPLYRLILGNIRDPDEAFDLLQETFVSAYGALARFDIDRSMAAWLSRIAINKCRDWGRRRKLRQFWRLLVPDDAAERVLDDAIGADVVVGDRDELRRTERAIAELPQSLREPLLMQAVEGLSQAEVAESLGISAKAVETRVRRARIALVLALGEKSIPG